MDFTLKNVGIIKDSTIKLDGLTVITGANNSGKSTIGKALYSTVEGLNGLDNKRIAEIRFNFVRLTFEIQSLLNFAPIYSAINLEKCNPEDVPYINLIAHSYINDSEVRNIEFIFGFKDFLSKFNSGYLLNTLKDSDAELSVEILAYVENFDSLQQKALKSIMNLDPYLSEDYKKQFVEKSFVGQFNKEFAGQILPINAKPKVNVSEIKLSKNNEVGCDVKIEGGSTISESNKNLNNPFFTNAILIDDSLILDDMRTKERRAKSPFGVQTLNHNERLISLLTSDDSDSIIEKEINEKQFLNVLSSINEILPGELKKEKGEYFYSENGKAPLKVENLATGSKIFTIIKTLILKSKLNINTMLILDEPETHLHPEWQKLFAKILVLLVKELDVTVLLTTHSVYFALAIDTYMRQFEIEKQTNFYITEFADKNCYQVNYKCVNENLDEIYADFVKPFNELMNQKTKFED